jgi:DNA-binding GntR family transcriptional regulator
VLYANVRASAKQDRAEYKSHEGLDDADLDRLRKAQEEFRNLAARMRAFALNESFAVRLVKWCDHDPLLSVSNTIDTYGQDRATAAKTLEQVLHFRIAV